ncbi:hypothetical protein IWW38_005384, partial [Coemansia aciculifera]
KVPVTDESKERVYEIFEKLSGATEYYSRVFESAIQWSMGALGNGVGDSQMHHFVGCILRNKARYQEAEAHFLVGTSESPAALGLLLFEWASRSESKDYGVFVARGVLKYLAMGWYEAACSCWRAFVGRLAQAQPEAVAEKKSESALASNIGPIYYLSGHELANFVQLLLLTVERADGSPSSESARIFGSLRKQYEGQFDVNAEVVHGLLDEVAQKYFGVVVHRQQSLFDMVSSMFAPPSRPAVTGSGNSNAAEDMD